MNIGLSNADALRAAYSYINESQKRTTNKTEFAESLNKAREAAKTSVKQNAEILPGDVVISYPPNLTGNLYINKTLTGKTKEEMTLDEYKQWFMGEISGYPVSGWARSTFSAGTIVIKEEAFERMQKDSDYEKYVMNRVRSSFSVTGLPVGANHVGYDVIGASPEECYGYAGPIGNSGSGNSLEDGNSWWEKRHERLENLLKEQQERVRRKPHRRWHLQQ